MYRYRLSFLLALFTTSALVHAAPKTQIGMVSVRACLEQSREGRQARELLESFTKNCSREMETINKQISDLSAKADDQDAQAAMSAQGKKALEGELENLLREREVKRMRLSQETNEMQMLVMQRLFGMISRASEQVAQELGLDVVIQEDAALYIAPSLDITPAVLNKLDANATQSPPSNQPQPTQPSANRTTAPASSK